MSKPVKPEAIGAFVLGGLALLVLGLLSFGGDQILKPRIQWVVYFDSSLNGLNVGAPVKIQGVQVGVVKDIELQIDDSLEKLMKPVVLEVDPTRIVSTTGTPIDIGRFTRAERTRDFEKLLKSGLRARLEVQSILTGLLYVDLDFQPDQPSRLTGLGYQGLPEVPSVPPTVDEVLATLEAAVQKIGDLPVDALMKELLATLAEVRRVVSAEENRRSQVALAQSLESTQRILSKLEKGLPDLVFALDGIARDVKARTPSLLLETERTLSDTGAAASQLVDVTESDSELMQSVREIDRAAQSIRDLTDYLQRHPESVLFGRGE